MSAYRMIERIEDIISGVYKSRGGNWGPRELDVASLIKAYGGSRLLYETQKANAHHTPHYEHEKIPELLVSTGQPTLGKERQPSSLCKVNKPMFDDR